MKSNQASKLLSIMWIAQSLGSSLLRICLKKSTCSTLHVQCARKRSLKKVWIPTLVNAALEPLKLWYRLTTTVSKCLTSPRQSRSNVWVKLVTPSWACLHKSFTTSLGMTYRRLRSKLTRSEWMKICHWWSRHRAPRWTPCKMKGQRLGTLSSKWTDIPSRTRMPVCWKN